MFDQIRRVADELTNGKKKEHDELTDQVIYGMIYEACGDRNGTINLD